MATPKSTRAHADAAHALLAERLPAERQRLFEASAIIDVCRYACASKLEGFDTERLIDALRAAGALIDGAADALSDDNVSALSRSLKVFAHTEGDLS